MRIRLNEKDFETLISGDVVINDQDGIKIELILSDIGYDFMLDFINKKRYELLAKTNKDINDFPEDPQDALVCDSCQ